MDKIKDVYIKAWGKATEFKTLIVFLAITNIVFLFFGHWMAAKGIPAVVELKRELLKELPELNYLRPLTGPLAPYLSLKIAYTFSFNLIVGAFLSTILPGIIFFIPYIITVFRAWIVGVIFYGIMPTELHLLVFYGTFILEFGGYVFSSAAGINIGLSILNPAWKGEETRTAAFKSAIEDASLLLILTATFLLLGAVWEIGWLHFLSSKVNLAPPIITES